jgi:hypothetical protein
MFKISHNSAIFKKTIAYFKIVAIINISLITSSLASETECESLKNKFNSGIPPIETKSFLTTLERLISFDNMCAKNLLGRIYYTGNPLNQDTEKGYAIFYDLARKGYPPALYNIAYIAIKEKRESPEAIIELLHGIMINYLGDRDWGYISANSRELAWDYLNEIKNDTNPEIYKILYERHRQISSESTLKLANAVRARTQEVREQSDAIVGLLAIGAASYAVGQRLATINRPTYIYSNQFLPRNFTVIQTGNPNILYFLPR